MCILTNKNAHVTVQVRLLKEIYHMNILSLDIGTTSMRGILYSEEGNELGMKSCLTPLVFRGEYIEQDPDVFTNALVEICKDVQQYGSVDAISLTAFRSAPTIVDENGKALANFIMWQDTRNKEICERIAPHNETLYQTTGAKVNAVFTASKITWFKENEPELYKKAYKAMIVPDYLIHHMTGVFSTDRTYGSRTSLMNIHTLEWDKGMCDLFNVDIDKLCPLVDQGTIVGHTHEAFEKETGIPAGVPVISAGGDQQCSALGLGELDTSSFVINCGTGSFIISLIDQPYMENPSMICNVASVRNKWTVESNVLSSAASLNWLIKELFPDLWNEGSPNFRKFNEIASTSPLGSNGVICVPLFQGCGTRDWNLDARASFSHISLGTTRADLARSMYEGIAAEIVKSVNALPESCHLADHVFIGGGLTKSDLFDQILCDMLGKKLLRYEDAQATAIGAFASASVELGLYKNYQEALNAVRKDSVPFTFEPNMENHKAYQSYIEKTEKVYEVLNH